ncbi:GNAT family N-acetyltransferase [Methanosphaera sp.]
MIIRREEKKDYIEVEAMVREAFWNIYRPGCLEHYIVHTLRDSKEFVEELDYLIEEDDKILAHIMYAEGTLETDGKNEKLLMFGPLSVHPDYQKRGYGSKLLEYTLNVAQKLGYPAVCVVGSSEYYSRFGFETASNYNIHYKGVTGEAPFFMIKFLDKTYKNKIHGIYSDPSCFMPDRTKVDEYDKKFPPKKKEKRPGQLE